MSGKLSRHTHGTGRLQSDDWIEHLLQHCTVCSGGEYRGVEYVGHEIVMYFSSIVMLYN